MSETSTPLPYLPTRRSYVALAEAIRALPISQDDKEDIVQGALEGLTGKPYFDKGRFMGHALSDFEDTPVYDTDTDQWVRYVGGERVVVYDTPTAFVRRTQVGDTLADEADEPTDDEG